MANNDDKSKKSSHVVCDENSCRIVYDDHVTLDSTNIIIDTYDIGKDYTYNDLNIYKENTFLHLEDVINKIENYIDNEEYKG